MKHPPHSHPCLSLSPAFHATPTWRHWIFFFNTGSSSRVLLPRRSQNLYFRKPSEFPWAISEFNSRGWLGAWTGFSVLLYLPKAGVNTTDKGSRNKPWQEPLWSSDESGGQTRPNPVWLCFLFILKPFKNNLFIEAHRLILCLQVPTSKISVWGAPLLIQSQLMAW